MTIDTHDTQSEISVARKRFKEFKRLPSLTEKVLGPQILAGRGTSTDPLYDFEIDSTSVTQMVKEGKTYYTMAILRENSSEDSFENLVISEDGGENEAYLIKYFPSAEYYNRLATNPHAPFVGGMSLQEIEPSSIGARIVGITCVTFTQVFCNYGGGEHPATENCTEAYIYSKSFTSCFTSSVLEEQPERFVDITPPGNGGGGGGGGTSGNNNPLYPSPTNPTPSNPNAPQEPGLVNPDGTGTIVSEPVIPVSMVRVLGLNLAQKAWWNDVANAEAVGIITEYWNESDKDIETRDFNKTMIQHCIANNLNNEDAKDYVISNIIEEQIDDSNLDDCTKDILNDLKNLENNDISKMMRRFEVPNSPYKVKIIKASIPTPAFQVILGNTSGTIDDILIKLNQNHFNDQKGTKLLKAAVIMHEMIHALMYSIVYDYNQGNNTSIEDFPEIWENYINITQNTPSPNQHIIMADHFVSVIADALGELDNHQHPQELYTDLAWFGLEGTEVYQTTPSLTQADRNRIEDDRFWAEAHNINTNTVQPSTSPCD